MRFSSVERAPEDASLAIDIFGGKGGTTPLLRAGVKLDDRYRRALIGAGISRILVEDSESEGIVVRHPLPVGARLEAAAKLASVHDGARQALSRREGIPYSVIKLAAEITSMIGHEVLDSPDVPVTLLDGSSSDSHRIQHAIDVTVLGLLIGRRLFPEHGRIVGGGARSVEGIDDALRRMALGLLLHDIAEDEDGDVFEISDGYLVEGSADHLRSHAEAGHRALPHSIVSAHAAAVVRHHHERWNGTGPNGLVSQRIPQFARVAAVADVFDALTSDRPGVPALPPHVAMATIVRSSGSLFDPEVADTFRRIVAPYPMGTEVTLTDGSSGVVAAVPNDMPLRPCVRLLRDPRGKPVKATEVSLHRERDLAIAAAA